MEPHRLGISTMALLAALACTSSCTGLQGQSDAAGPGDSIKQWLGLDARTLDLKRQLVALQYVSPVYPVGNYGAFTVRDASVSCPKIELDGIFITTKAKMTIEASGIAREKDSPVVTLGCRRGTPCIEIKRGDRQAVYWQEASLVTASPATAQALAGILESCIDPARRTAG